MWDTREKMTDGSRPWGMERRKVEVESWSPLAVVCGILRRTAANSASNNSSVWRPIAVSDGTAVRHKQMQPPPPHPTSGQLPVRHLRTSPPHAPRSYATRVACICQPADPQTVLLRTTKWAAGPAVVNCFKREKETHAPSCRRRRSAKPTHTDCQTDGPEKRTDGRTDSRVSQN